MGAFFIQTEIAPDRISSAGQPPWETIELDSFLYYKPLLITPFAETVRFSDYLRRGGESVRYYHLTAYSRGLTLSLSPSGRGRLISGIYHTRELSLLRQPSPIARLLHTSHAQNRKPLQLAQISHLCLDLDDGGRVIARLNCLESFDDRFVWSASLRIPQLLLHGHPEAAAFSALVQHHLASSAPFFSPQVAITLDASLTVDVARTEGYPAKAVLQVGADDRIALPLQGGLKVL